MTSKHHIPKEQLVQLLEDTPFEHQTSSVHVLDASREAQRHELAGVSIYSNACGWMAQVNWRAVVDADEITLRVGDTQSGEHAYELRDAERLEIRVEDEGGAAMTDDEMSALVAQTSLAKSWEQDVVNVLKQTRNRQATVH